MNLLFMALGVYHAEGGIERFNRRLLRAFEELRRDGLIASATSISLWDRSSDDHQSQAELQVIAGNSSKLRALAAFTRELLISNLDVIIYGHILLLPLSLLGRVLRPGARQLLIIHGIEAWNPLHPFMNWVLRVAIDTVVSVSRYTAAQMRSHSALHESAFRILPNAVDVDESPYRKRNATVRHNEKRHTLLVVSRLSTDSRHKNVDKIILCLPSIQEKFPDTQLNVIGHGDWLNELKVIARENGIAEHVHFVGEIDDDQKDVLYSTSDVFVLPSTGEGFGIVYLEAWMNYLPVVGGDQGGASELIRTGIDGLCVAPIPDEISMAVCQLLSDSDMRTRLGMAGRSRVVKEFSHEKFRYLLANILKEQIDVRSGGSSRPRRRI